MVLVVGRLASSEVSRREVLRTDRDVVVRVDLMYWLVREEHKYYERSQYQGGAVEAKNSHGQEATFAVAGM